MGGAILSDASPCSLHPCRAPATNAKGVLADLEGHRRARWRRPWRARFRSLASPTELIFTMHRLLGAHVQAQPQRERRVSRTLALCRVKAPRQGCATAGGASATRRSEGRSGNRGSAQDADCARHPAGDERRVLAHLAADLHRPSAPLRRLRRVEHDLAAGIAITRSPLVPPPRFLGIVPTTAGRQRSQSGTNASFELMKANRRGAISKVSIGPP